MEREVLKKIKMDKAMMNRVSIIGTDCRYLAVTQHHEVMKRC